MRTLVDDEGDLIEMKEVNGYHEYIIDINNAGAFRRTRYRYELIGLSGLYDHKKALKERKYV